MYLINNNIYKKIILDGTRNKEFSVAEFIKYEPILSQTSTLVITKPSLVWFQWLRVVLLYYNLLINIYSTL